MNLWAGVAFLFFIGGFCACGQNKSGEKEKPRPPFPELREGDLAFRRGIGVMSQVVLATDKQGTYSHIGIVVRHEGKWKIIHAVPGEPDFKGDPDRVKMDDPDVFFSKERAGSGALMRVVSSQLQAGYAASKAIEVYENKVLFDHSYDSGDRTKMYCTELVEFVYQGAGVDLTQGRCHRVPFLSKNGEVILPSDIQDCRKLEIIYEY